MESRWCEVSTTDMFRQNFHRPVPSVTVRMMVHLNHDVPDGRWDFNINLGISLELFAPLCSDLLLHELYLTVSFVLVPELPLFLRPRFLCCLSHRFRRRGFLALSFALVSRGRLKLVKAVSINTNGFDGNRSMQTLFYVFFFVV
jgi:hypothetical protein